MTTFEHKTYHRHILEKFLKKHAHLIGGTVLDIGSKNRRYDSWFSGTITAVDLEPNFAANVLYGDVEEGLNFSDQSFESIICLEVFEYLENYQKAISEIYRLLKPGGGAFISIPFMYHEHGDKMRFTKNFLSKQFSQFSSAKIENIGNAYTTIWDILRKKWLLGRGGWRGSLIWYFVLLPLLYLIKPHENLEDKYYSGLFIILRK